MTLAALVLSLPVASSAFADAVWTAQTSGTTNSLLSVDFVDATHGWAVGSSGTILATTDGGAQWTPQSSDTTVGLSSIDFVSDTTGWAVGGKGKSYDQTARATILKTTDGGAHWTPQAPGTTDGVALYSVAFVDASHGWTVGYAYDPAAERATGVILATTDGGAHWNPQDSGVHDMLMSVDFIDASRGWAVGDSGIRLKTTDSGTTWVNYGASYEFESVNFLDASTGWAVGSDGYICKTTDGGATWTWQRSGVFGHLTSVHFVDATSGWAVGWGDWGDHTILSTADGGTTWAPQDSGPTNWLESVDFIDANHGWAVGAGGTILHLGPTPTPTPPTPTPTPTPMPTPGPRSAPTLSNPVTPGIMSRTKPYAVCATLKPRHAAGSYPVRIYKYRLVAGVWKSMGYVNARAANYSSYTKCSASVKLPTRGKWRLRAYASADREHSAKWSRGYAYVRVR